MSKDFLIGRWCACRLCSPCLFPVIAIGNSRKKAHHLRNIGVKLEFCSLLSTRLGRCALVVSKMMLISAEKVAWVMSELKVDARRSEIRCWDPPVAPQGTPTNSYHFSNWLSFSNRQRLIQNLKQRITLINENLKRRCIFQLKFWNNAVCCCHFKKNDAVAAVSEVFLLQEEIWRTICTG